MRKQNLQRSNGSSQRLLSNTENRAVICTGAKVAINDRFVSLSSYPFRPCFMCMCTHSTHLFFVGCHDIHQKIISIVSKQRLGVRARADARPLKRSNKRTCSKDTSWLIFGPGLPCTPTTRSFTGTTRLLIYNLGVPCTPISIHVPQRMGNQHRHVTEQPVLALDLQLD